MNTPKLVSCPVCGQERVAMNGDATACGDCRRLLGVMDAAAVALRVTHPMLAAQLRTEMARMERTD